MTPAVKRLGLACGTGMLVLALGASQRPSILSRVHAGLWEISGAPGAQKPVRICIGDLARLAQFEHRKASCTRTVIRDASDYAEVRYSCGAGGFGHTSMRLLTPRSLRVETQGISGNVPFHYVLQARRVGNCR